MSGISFYVVDCETTGLDSKKHEVNEISIIRCSDKVQLTEFIICDYPERASIDALNITGKSFDDLLCGNTKEYVINKINKFLNEDNLTPLHRCFIAHNSNFDMKFIHALYEKVGQECPVSLWLDTIPLTKTYTTKIGLQKPKLNLQSACDIVGVKKVAGMHSSKSDSRNTYLLYKDLVEQKNIDYIDLIKTSVHKINNSQEEDL